MANAILHFKANRAAPEYCGRRKQVPKVFNSGGARTMKSSLPFKGRAGVGMGDLRPMKKSGTDQTRVPIPIPAFPLKGRSIVRADDLTRNAGRATLSAQVPVIQRCSASVMTNAATAMQANSIWPAPVSRIASTSEMPAIRLMTARGTSPGLRRRSNHSA